MPNLQDEVPDKMVSLELAANSPCCMYIDMYIQSMVILFQITFVNHKVRFALRNNPSNLILLLKLWKLMVLYILSSYNLRNDLDSAMLLL